jgi:hypothetical protein
MNVKLPQSAIVNNSPSSTNSVTIPSGRSSSWVELRYPPMTPELSIDNVASLSTLARSYFLRLAVPLLCILTTPQYGYYGSFFLSSFFFFLKKKKRNFLFILSFLLFLFKYKILGFRHISPSQRDRCYLNSGVAE